jgi:anti-sigma factor RsiW
MMTLCPYHGDLVHELALGRLADADALRGEHVLAGCETCRAAYASLDHPEVARGVAEGIAAFRTPAARPAVRPAVRRWPLRAAAVLALTAGGGAAWMAHQGLPDRSLDSTAGAGREASREAGEVILAEGLESGGPGELETTLRPPEVIFADDLESGDLGSWRSSS